VDHRTRLNGHRTCPVLTGLVRREFVKLTTSPDSEHRTVRCSPDLCAERVAKRPHTGRTPTDAPRASGALKQIPSASVRPHRTHEQRTPCVRCSTLAGSSTDSTPDARDSVQCLCALCPVSVSQRENTPVTSPNFPPAQWKIYTYFSQKRRIPPLSTL